MSNCSYEKLIRRKSMMKGVIVLLTIAFLYLPAAVSAQSRVTQHERLKNLKERLNLTEEQYAEADQILTKSYDEVLKLRASENPDREGFRKIRDESNREILRILDEKQKSEFNTMLDEGRNFRHRDLINKNQ